MHAIAAAYLSVPQNLAVEFASRAKISKGAFDDIRTCPHLIHLFQPLHHVLNAPGILA